MKIYTANDAAALTFVQGQAYRINQRVYETRYPDLDFSRFIYVNTEGDPWAAGVVTYFSDMSGVAKWQSAAAKDIPLADVSQSMELRGHHLAAIGYQYNIQEVNQALASPVPSLPIRRAQAARLAYQTFMWNVTFTGNAEKNLKGLVNYTGVPVVPAPADGTGTSRLWVNSSGVGIKTPALIVRDINLGLQRVNLATKQVEYADTVLLPPEALNYIAGTPYSAMSQETILSFIQRTNLYTMQTGRPLTIRALSALSAAGTDTTSPSSAGKGRMVIYKNDPAYVQLHLPMPHQFLPAYADGPLNTVIPGIFRTGGVEFLTPSVAAYVDGISETPA